MTALKILLADDEMALRFLLTETLNDEGYDIIEAFDCKEAGVTTYFVKPFSPIQLIATIKQMI
jgi:DNA-binding response OmpR family regulator